MIRIATERFDPAEESRALCAGRNDAGALVSFVGLVRDEGGRLRSLTLEHYPGMAERRLAEIEAEARRRWPLIDVAIVHRVGRLFPGEPIVLVAVTSAHRAAAFAAAEFLMDWLKTRAPFWKYEESRDGGHWVAARLEDESRAERWETDEGA